MKNLPNVTTTVQLDSIGERTKSRWVGTFTIKRILTHADHFKLDRIYASLMPSRSADVSEEQKLKAAAIAELAVRVINGPAWWDGTNSGQLMVDSDPLYDLISKCNEEEQKWAQEIEESAKFENSNTIDTQKPS